MRVVPKTPVFPATRYRGPVVRVRQDVRAGEVWSAGCLLGPGDGAGRAECGRFWARMIPFEFVSFLIGDTCPIRLA